MEELNTSTEGDAYLPSESRLPYIEGSGVDPAKVLSSLERATQDKDRLAFLDTCVFHNLDNYLLSTPSKDVDPEVVGRSLSLKKGLTQLLMERDNIVLTEEVVRELKGRERGENKVIDFALVNSSPQDFQQGAYELLQENQAALGDLMGVVSTRRQVAILEDRAQVTYPTVLDLVKELDGKFKLKKQGSKSDTDERIVAAALTEAISQENPVAVISRDRDVFNLLVATYGTLYSGSRGFIEEANNSDVIAVRYFHTQGVYSSWSIDPDKASKTIEAEGFRKRARRIARKMHQIPLYDAEEFLGLDKLKVPTALQQQVKELGDKYDEEGTPSVQRSIESLGRNYAYNILKDSRLGDRSDEEILPYARSYAEFRFLLGNLYGSKPVLSRFSDFLACLQKDGSLDFAKVRQRLSLLEREFSNGEFGETIQPNGTPLNLQDTFDHFIAYRVIPYANDEKPEDVKTRTRAARLLAHEASIKYRLTQERLPLFLGVTLRHIDWGIEHWDSLPTSEQPDQKLMFEKDSQKLMANDRLYLLEEVFDKMGVKDRKAVFYGIEQTKSDSVVTKRDGRYGYFVTPQGVEKALAFFDRLNAIDYRGPTWRHKHGR